jgi:hypothetical protein
MRGSVSKERGSGRGLTAEVRMDENDTAARRLRSHPARFPAPGQAIRRMTAPLLVAASILAATPVLLGTPLAHRDFDVAGPGRHRAASGFDFDAAHASTGPTDRPLRRLIGRSPLETVPRMAPDTSAYPNAAPEMANVPPATTRPPPEVRPQPEQNTKECSPGSDEIDQLVRLSQKFLAQGDVAAARQILERAARAHDPRAMLMLAATYDPEGLRRMGTVGIQPDLDQAFLWYKRARELGCHQAGMELVPRSPNSGAGAPSRPWHE